VAPLDHDLHQRPEQQRVAHRHEVHRAAHQRHSHRLAVGEHAAELVRVEALEPRPQPVVGRRHRLRLQPHEVPDRVAHGDVDPPQQELALEQCPVQLPPAEDPFGGHPRHHAEE
jgi:hypothetical protein